MIKRQAKSSKTRATGTGAIATPAQLRKAISRLSPAHPFTDRFSAKWVRARVAPREHAKTTRATQKERTTGGYDEQYEQWLGWLKEYDGPGAYGRTGSGYSAAFAYNHIVNPQMLIYLAEIVRIERALLNAAARAALANLTTMSSMSGAIRRVLPWSVVERALLAKS